MEKLRLKYFSNNKVLFYTNIILVVVIIPLAVFFTLSLCKRGDSDTIIRDKSDDFKFTNPILDCEDSGQDDNIILSSSGVNHEVEELKEKYDLHSLSFYFRDLNNGPWLGIGESEVFSPASLLKTPIVMGLFKYAEKKPDILNKEVLVTENDVIRDLNQNIISPNVLEKDKKYTILQVAESVLKNSDNAGVQILLNNIPSDYIAKVFYSIGVPFKDTENEVNLKVKDYAGFFRVLFNSSYLSREMSDKILEIMSQSEYKKGIVAGVPEDIAVAHKFGEREIGEIRQLHDCGIVYYPEDPYLICIMTKGSNFEKQQSAISELSAFVYQEIKNNK